MKRVKQKNVDFCSGPFFSHSNNTSHTLQKIESMFIPWITKELIQSKVKFEISVD